MRGWIGLGKFVGNRVREVDVGAVVDALKTPFKRGKPKPFTAGIDEDTTSDPMPDWWPGQTADDYVWPGQSTADDYAWPKDHDKSKRRKPPPEEPSHVSPHVSPHAPDQREDPVTTKGTPVTSTPTTPAMPTAADYAHIVLDRSTPGTQAEKLEHAATSATRDADEQAERAEEFLRRARRIDHMPAMEAEAEDFRTEARHLKDQAEARREIATEFRNAASAKASS